MKPTCLRKLNRACELNEVKHNGIIINNMCGLLSVSPSGFIIPLKIIII
jgi:hypothetical protein